MSKLKNVAGLLLSGDMDIAASSFVDNAYSKISEDIKWPTPTTDIPDDDELQEMVSDGYCEATDGCEVESDGVCPHGHPSWILRMGLI